VGPFLAGVLSDQWGLQQALAVVPLFSTFAAVLFIVAMRSYDADVAQISDVKLDVAPVHRVIEMAPGESALMDRRAST